MATKKRTSFDALADAAKAQADAKQLEKREFEAYGRELVKLTKAGGKGTPERIALSLAAVKKALDRVGTVSSEKSGTVGANQPPTTPAQATPQDNAHAVFRGGAVQGSQQ